MGRAHRQAAPALGSTETEVSHLIGFGWPVGGSVSREGGAGVRVEHCPTLRLSLDPPCRAPRREIACLSSTVSTPSLQQKLGVRKRVNALPVAVSPASQLTRVCSPSSDGGFDVVFTQQNWMPSPKNSSKCPLLFYDLLNLVQIYSADFRFRLRG